MRRFAKPLLLILFGVETFSATYALSPGKDARTASVFYFLSGLSIALLAIGFPAARLPAFKKTDRLPAAIKMLIAGVMVYTAFIIGRYWFNLIPLDPDYADMLPVIRTMNERFIHGDWKQVYEPIQEIWQGVKPVYLPAMWAPYSIPLLLHLDIRWLSVFSLLLSFGIFLWMLRLRNQGLYPVVLICIAGMLFWWLFAADDRHGLLSLSEEGLIILYYVLLAAAIVSGNIYLIGLAVCFCMLSRYALIGWIPAFMVWLCWKQQFRAAGIFILIGIAGCALLFLLPFGFGAFERLLQLPGNYISFAGRVWNDSPEVFWLSLGLAKFFGADGTRTLHSLLLIFSFGLPLLFMLVCLYIGKFRVLNNLPLATLKLSLVFFYNFIDVPYLYLFYTSVFVSLIMVTLLTSQGFRLQRSGR